MFAHFEFFLPFKAFANFSELLLKNEIIGADDAAQFYDAIESLGFGLLRKISIGEFLNFEDLLARDFALKIYFTKINLGSN